MSCDQSFLLSPGTSFLVMKLAILNRRSTDMKTAGRAKFSFMVLMLIVTIVHVLLITPFGFSF